MHNLTPPQNTGKQPPLAVDIWEVLAPGAREAPGEYCAKAWAFFGPETDADGAELPRWGKWSGSLADALESHLVSGSGAPPLAWANGREVRAFGVSYPAEARVCWLSFDLDGGYDVEDAAQRLAAICGGVLLTPSGGTPGHFRAMVHLQKPAPVSLVEQLGASLARSIGLTPKTGALEVFPSTTRNGRLPFGQGACTGVQLLPSPAGLVRIPWGDLYPAAMLQRLRELPGFDPFMAARVHGVEAPRSQSWDKPRPTLKGRRSMPSDARRWLKKGADRGERDNAIRALILGFMYAERSEGAILRILDEQAPSLFARTRRDVEKIREDLPRQVRNITRRYRNRRPEPVGLTPLEAERLQVLCERKAQDSTELRALVRFGARALERFKGAVRAGWREIQVHHSEWIEWANGDRGLYARLRAVLAVFHTDGRYLPTSRAFHAGDARSKRWRCSFPFEHGKKPPARRISSETRPILALRALARRAAARGASAWSGKLSARLAVLVDPSSGGGSQNGASPLKRRRRGDSQEQGPGRGPIYSPRPPPDDGSTRTASLADSFPDHAEAPRAES